jgi:hypothetical protein
VDELSGKWIQWLNQLVPKLSRLAVLTNSANPTHLATDRVHRLGLGNGRTAPAVAPDISYLVLSVTSSSGADHGYGSIFSRAGSPTRGPMALGQMYSQIGPNRTRS